MVIYIIISLIILITDQLSKIFVSSYINNLRVEFIPNIINIVYRKNTGAAFSILSDHVQLLGIISAVFCVCVIIFIIRKKPKHPLLLTATTLVFSGALGNGIDRIFRGYVIDFIETAFIKFPVFNIADISITIGAVLLIIYFMFFDKN